MVRHLQRRGALLLIALRSSSSATATEQACSSSTASIASSAALPYTLAEKRQLSPDSYWLRYSLPPGRLRLGDDPTLPTCIKLLYPNGTDEKTAKPKPLEKSYSPVSHPGTEGFMDLIVKAYPPRPGGGVGRFLCDMKVGETTLGTVKSKRLMHGDAAVLGRWSRIGLVAGGTGIAPLLQIAKIVLSSRDPSEASTTVQLLFFNRGEEDILAREEIELLAAEHPSRFSATYSLTGQHVPEGWQGYTGRGDAAMVAAALPPPTGDGKTMILVCGTDGFVSTWGGPVGRAPRQSDGSKGAKVQGPLLGLLADAGYSAEEVFKY